MPITEEINKKIAHYVERMRACDNAQDYEGYISVIDEYHIYLDGVLSLERDTSWRTYYFQIQNSINIVKRHMVLLKNLKAQERDTVFKLNELTDEVRRLKERMDNWESRL